MKNGLLYAGLVLAGFLLIIVFPLQVLLGNFKSSYLLGVLFWLIVGAACLSELKKRKNG